MHVGTLSVSTQKQPALQRARLQVDRALLLLLSSLLSLLLLLVVAVVAAVAVVFVAVTNL